MAKSKKSKNKRPFIVTLILFIIISAAIYFIAGELIERQSKLMYPKKYEQYVEMYSEKYGIDCNIIYSVIHTESGFDPQARSSAGAIGLMQITPDTYDWLLYLRGEEKTRELDDIRTNIDFGTYFLSYLYKKFGNWDTVFAAYNAGMNRVSGWLEDPAYSDGITLTYIPFSETRNYVDKVGNTIIKYKQIYNEE
ncbi:MAG: lytic transglycosylase domain-containing protein [Ruminococcaceae bacterium]|nr:lytic transglycosylase domain-containing protein [Oscillospiraceae bacterium]